MAFKSPLNLVGRWTRAIAGIAWLLISAGMVAGNHRSFWLVFGFVFGGAVFTGVIVLIWMTRWALRTESRRAQFSIATLLLVILLAALYLAAVRWLVVHTGTGNRAPPERSAVFVMAAVFCALHVLISIPFVMGILDGLVWLSVWLARHSVVQRLLNRPRFSSEEMGSSRRDDKRSKLVAS